MKSIIKNYITELSLNQNLSHHTLKAYNIDITQMSSFMSDHQIIHFKEIDKHLINLYLKELKDKYEIRTTKRKIVSIKKFFNYLLIENIIEVNPFDQINIKFTPIKSLPKTIVFQDIKKIYDKVYENYRTKGEDNLFYLTEVIIIELLYTTGIRVSELSSMTVNDINIRSKTILIHGKGKKDRIVFITNSEIIILIKQYLKLTKNSNNHYFLKNRRKEKISTQSIRLRIKRLCNEANITSDITPHMFRHTFATSLLEEEVNLMYIQDLLGHSSLSTTQIYISINKKKQQRLINRKHPRKQITTSINNG